METEQKTYLDPNDFYSQEMDTWKELWDNKLSLYENTANILQQAVLLPQKELMLPILATYILIPSKWARVLPILFSWGGKGSGKSTTSIFASRLHGFKQTFSATDTFSSIRNALDAMRWLDPIDKQFEKEGAILCWDNIHIGTLERDERIYQLLLFGYSRSSDKILIAGSDGTNREYHVFCPKIISSVDDIHMVPHFEELHRRLLIIPHKSFNDFSATEKAVYVDFDVNSDRLDLDSIHWDGIENEFFNFWDNPENGKAYARYRTQLTRKGKKFDHSMRSEQFLISVDLVATGLIVGTWKTPNQAIEHLETYWDYVNNHIFNQLSATIQHLQQFIDDEIGTQREFNTHLATNGHAPIKLIISPQKLKKRIEYHRSRGELDITPRPKDIVEIMARLGWRLSNQGWIEK